MKRREEGKEEEKGPGRLERKGRRRGEEERAKRI